LIPQVDVCDKVDTQEDNPFIDVSYYSTFSYTLLDGSGETVTFDSTPAKDPTGEIQVLEKVIPVNESGSTAFWLNDTVEVFRSCPSYGTETSGDTVTIIGRNFHESNVLYCRYTPCTSTDIGPRKCRNSNWEASSTKQKRIQETATYISSTRVECPAPTYSFPTNTTLLYLEGICEYDSSGRLAYVQECSESALSDGSCENDAATGYHFVYDTLVVCTEDSIASGVCDDNPTKDRMWNPCYTAEIRIDVTVSGSIFSGDGLEYAHSSLPDYFAGNNYVDYIVDASFATFTVVNEAYWVSDTHTVDMDMRRCNISRASQEGQRVREKGWFMLRALQTALLSFDLSHLPADMVYDEHYKLAIYITPSRCDDEVCNSARLRLPAEENLPCRQSVDFPSGFLDDSVPKNQILNFSVFALEDLLIKTEIHLMYGLHLPSASFFKNTTTVQIISPSRAKTDKGSIQEGRMLNPYVSYEERLVKKDYFFAAVYYSSLLNVISAPLNMPPRYADFTKGRVLMGFNISSQNTDTPWLKDSKSDVSITSDYWDNPASSNELGKEMKDTFHEVFDEFTVDGEGNPVYDFTQLILPYMPYFSNCRGYDSHIPIYALLESSECSLPDDHDSSWWRYNYPVFPQEDDVVYVGPLDVGQSPIADWCTYSIECQYEEDLENVDITPRWFEAATGDNIFYLIRESITWQDFTGRAATRIGFEDAGTGAKINSLDATEGSDVFVPVSVNRGAANTFRGGCTDLCYPRTIMLNIAYYQLNTNTKRIVAASLVFDDFDKDPAVTDYTIDISYYPLDYWELIIKFAFGRPVFLALFVVIGCISVLVTALFWLNMRITTQLVRPPRFRFWSMFSLIAPPAFTGTLLGLIPIVIMTAALYIFVYGPPYLDTTNWILDNYKLHYMDIAVDPDNDEKARFGRLGLGFITVSAVCIWQGACIFLPDHQSKRAREMELKRDSRAEKEEVWIPLTWRRSNLVFSSYVMGLFCLFIVEFSLWNNFGNYIWYVFLGFTLIDMFIGDIVSFQLKEVLLEAPVGTALGLVMGVTGLGANDFVDFLLSNFVDLGLIMLFRVYIDPAMGDILRSIGLMYKAGKSGFINKIPAWLAVRLAVKQDKYVDTNMLKKPDEDIAGEGGETVEPILDSFGGYSTDNLSTFYFPYIILLLMAFRDEVGLPSLYGIKEQDMEYYLWFSIIIIFFQICVDIFIHGVLELFHGWKIYDYLVYTKYRFLQRETRWKGLEDSLDECIDESMRTLDQMCFSSQYYMMMTILVNGIVYFVLGVQMMIRKKYNMWGDPMLVLVVPFTLATAYMTGHALLWVALQVNLWKIKHENTAWHTSDEGDDDFDIPDMDDLKGASHDAYLMNQRITSETFRYKFLNYNRSWLINQLPSILTPRTLKRSRPYLINQFARILNQLNRDVSSDSEDEPPDFGPVALTATSRKLIRWWLVRARKQVQLRETVQPLIFKARGTHCEQCLSKRQLQVQLVFKLEDLATKFAEEHPSDEFDKVAWKRFWMQNQRYKTVCLKCVSSNKEQDRNKTIQYNMDNSDGENEQEYPDWGPVYLSASSQAILLQWYHQAQENVWGKNGRKRPQAAIHVSDDEGDENPVGWATKQVKLSAASRALAIRWLRTARARLQQRSSQS
ncbi:unnamed protein product, partial [Choristocarpus tenellus]